MKTGKQIIEEVKIFMADNGAKLKSCSLPHKFTIPVDRITKADLPERRVFCEWKCELCGAIQDFGHKHWYELGLKHSVR